MNRKVVQYSALGGVGLSVLGGILYLLVFAGKKGDEGQTTAAKNEPTAEPSRSQALPSRPDPLFAAPVQIGKSAPQPVSDPFQHRRPQVIQTTYGDPEPRRLTPDPTASPLMPAGNHSQRPPAGNRRAAADEPITDEPDAGRSGAATDPFGLRVRGAAAATSEVPPPRKTAAAGKRAISSVNKNSSAPTGSIGSRYADSAAENNSAQSLIAPRSVDEAAESDLRSIDQNATTAAEAASVFDKARTNNRKSAAQSPKSNAAANGPLADRSGHSKNARVPSPAKNHTQRGTSIDNALPQIIAGAQDDGSASDLSGDHSIASPQNATQGARLLQNNGAGPMDSESQLGSGTVRGMDRDQTAGGNDSFNGVGSLPRSNPFSVSTSASGSGRPGSRQVEGKQSPQITIEKTAPEELQVGKAAKVELHVRNTGTVVAQNVEVRDLVPEGTQFVVANPPADPTVQGELIWPIGALKPGDETMIEIELMPIAEGEVGSVAVVTFQAEAGARSRVTKPDLTLTVTAPKQVMIGQEVLLSIKIANPGTGVATGVVIEERVPSGLKHPAGSELEFEVGTLKPGETRELDLALTAAQAGRIINQIAARGEASLQAQAQCELEVIAPALAISMDGPARRYLERQATYTVSVSNPGTAPAKDVELVTRLPKGLKFVKANNAGHYDPQTHAVVWSLEELPPAETGTVTLTAIPIEPGEQRLRAEGRAKQNLADEKEQITIVEGLAALLFEVVDVADPIEIKGETEYEIRITNQGSKAADNVRLVAQLPGELKFVSAEGPTRFVAEGDRVIFEPLARLAPKADITYRVAVQGLQAGDLRMKVQLMTDDMRQPVTKEESTRVYSDE